MLICRGAWNSVSSMCLVVRYCTSWATIQVASWYRTYILSPSHELRTHRPVLEPPWHSSFCFTSFPKVLRLIHSLRLCFQQQTPFLLHWSQGLKYPGACLVHMSVRYNIPPEVAINLCREETSARWFSPIISATHISTFLILYPLAMFWSKAFKSKSATTPAQSQPF